MRTINIACLSLLLTLTLNTGVLADIAEHNANAPVQFITANQGASPHMISTSETIATARISIAFNNETVIVRLFDNPASRELLALLPLSLQFSDFANAEKIAYLPNRLTTEGVPSARSASGDFTYYAPWGNLAVFYKGSSESSDLYVLGRIESGKEKLELMNANFNAVIAKVE